MKKTHQLKLLSYFVLTVFAGSAWGQSAPDVLAQAVDFPFARQRVHLQARAKVMLPALVGQPRFKNNLVEDCQRFEENYNRFAVHVDEESRDLASTVRELPLGYTMKPSYELHLGLELAESAKLIESEQWSLASAQATLHYENSSMMSISKTIGLEQKNVETDAQNPGVLSVRSRDLACDLLSGRAKLNSAINLEVRAGESETNQARRVVQSWLDQVRAVEKMDLNARQKAAWLGFQFESFKKPLETEKLAEYLNIHYFFETFFQPNQVILKPKWNADLSQIWQKKIQVNLPVEVEIL